MSVFVNSSPIARLSFLASNSVLRGSDKQENIFNEIHSPANSLSAIQKTLLESEVCNKLVECLHELEVSI